MAQIKNYKEGSISKHVHDEMRRECVFCKKEKPYSVFWSIEPNDCFYVCKDCEHIIRGLYIDVIFETSEQENRPIDSIIDELKGKVYSVKSMREKNLRK